MLSSSSVGAVDANVPKRGPIAAELEWRRKGTTLKPNENPPPGDVIRAHAPHVLEVYAQTRETVLETGVVERELKQLCARYLAEDDEVVARASDPAMTSASARRLHGLTRWRGGSDRADDDLWRRLHGAFTEPELVELGYSIAIMLGQQHWLATHGVAEDP